MQVQYDEPTTEWFQKHPERVIGFCLCRTCGLGYDESIAPHKCLGRYSGANKDLLSTLGIKPKEEPVVEKTSDDEWTIEPNGRKLIQPPNRRADGASEDVMRSEF